MSQVKIPVMKMITNSAVAVPGGINHFIIGLGEDNRCYNWNFDQACWLPQWNAEAPINRSQKRASAAQGKKK